MATTRVLQAIKALQNGERAHASHLLAEELVEGPPSGADWTSVSRLLQQVGEIDMAIEASRRAARSEPIDLNRVLAFNGLLASYGRTDEARAEMAKLPEAAQRAPAVLHFLGTLAAERGDFDEADGLFRKALAVRADLPATWFALAMNKTFEAGDADLTALEHLPATLGTIDPESRARLHYALGKAYDDIGEVEKAFAEYDAGAALRRSQVRYPAEQVAARADALIRDFTPDNLARLLPSQDRGPTALFVNGLPRSGTTLVERILTSHSAIEDGDEIDLFRPALIPTVDQSFAGALRYQEREPDDPWGSVAADYRRMLGMRFGIGGNVVDKTLSQSAMIGFVLHSMPGARMIWMRRRPEDVALSCYRTYFTSSVTWSWSLEDIASHMRTEDRLFHHWTGLFPDRILPVPYEQLVSDPEAWIPTIFDHVGLPVEPQVFEPHKRGGSVRTASVGQVRAPIATDRIGTAERYAAQLKPFTDAYRP